MNYKELSDKAYFFHSNNKLDEAEDLYQYLLSINSNDANILNLYGLLCLAKTDYNKAIELLSKALVLNKSGYIMSNLAKAYYLTSQFNKSLKLYEQAVELSPSDDIYYSMGILYKKTGLLDKAIEAYLNALKLNPNSYNSLYNLAVLYKETNNYSEAINIAHKAEFVNPNDEDIYSLLSNLYEINVEYNKAIQYLEKALVLNNKEVLYYYNLGVLYSKIGENELAIEKYQKLLSFQPNHVESLVNLSSLYRDIDKEKSLLFAKKAYNINPEEETVCLSYAQSLRDLYNNDESIKVLEKLSSAASFSLMAINYMDIQEYNLALENYNKALSLDANNLNYLHGKAMALKYLGDFDDAKLLLEYVVSKDENAIQSITTLGMMYLQEKNFEKGMQLYLKRSYETKFDNLFKEKIWTKNTNLNDKIVLVYSDCGLGDTIMFSRYLSKLESIAKKVILQTDRELVKILKSNFKNIDIILKTQSDVEYDIVIPIMNLAYALDLNFDNIPFSDKYLKIEKINLNVQKKKMGIFYQGNKRVFKNRSIPFSEISKLNVLEDYQLYSFQLDNYEAETNEIINLKNNIKNYSDTAGYLMSLDVLVTIDSSIAHMAGALGIKTFLLLPYTPEWRWFDDDEFTPWYKSVRIFKQRKNSDWSEVIDRVINELSNENK